MNLFNTIDIYVFTLFVIVVIFVNAYSKRDILFTQYKIFLSMLVINAIQLILAAATIIFDGLDGEFNAFMNITTNIVLYISTTLISVIWVVYCNHQVYRDEVCKTRHIIPLIIVFIGEALLILSSPITGWFFYLNESNLYIRGPFFMIHPIINLGILLYTTLFIWLNRNKIDKRYLPPLIFFIVPPLFFTVFQVLFYGLQLVWSGIALSLLIIYFNIQNRRINIDYLTGAYNRIKLDKYIQSKIRRCSPERTFSAIMIDLDDFKLINDTYGHSAGDKVLEDTVNLLKKCTRNIDFIARLGGDEFLIIMDISSKNVLEEAITRIKAAVLNYNETSGNPFTIRMSMGFTVYDPKFGTNVDDFIKHLDELMYKNKKIFKIKKSKL